MAELKYKYKFDSNYNPVYVNGAYGGIGSLGEIIIHFYLERNAVPTNQIVEFSEHEGTIQQTHKQFEPQDIETSIIRFVETGIVLNVQTAKDIVKWLNEKIATHESMSQSQ